MHQSNDSYHLILNKWTSKAVVNVAIQQHNLTEIYTMLSEKYEEDIASLE